MAMLFHALTRKNADVIRMCPDVIVVDTVCSCHHSVMVNYAPPTLSKTRKKHIILFIRPGAREKILHGHVVESS